MKPNIPLTWMTRQLKEMAEKGAAAAEEPSDGGTLTRRPRPARDDSTLKRHNTIGKDHLLAKYHKTELRHVECTL